MTLPEAEQHLSLALEAAVSADRAAGRHPFFVVGNAGTTNTGAVDDLEGLADLCGRERLWLHVDAAYGGFFLLTPDGREILKGISRSDSVVLDPHKGLFLPYGAGVVVVRDADARQGAAIEQYSADPHEGRMPLAIYRGGAFKNAVATIRSEVAITPRARGTRVSFTTG